MEKYCCGSWKRWQYAWPPWSWLMSPGPNLYGKDPPCGLWIMDLECFGTLNPNDSEICVLNIQTHKHTHTHGQRLSFGYCRPQQVIPASCKQIATLISCFLTVVPLWTNRTRNPEKQTLIYKTSCINCTYNEILITETSTKGGQLLTVPHVPTNDHW